MTGYYDGWCEAKRRLESAPDDEFLRNLVDNLRGLALHEYVEQELLKYDMDERLAPGDVTAEEVGQFLAGLDELRAPSQAEINAAKRELIGEIGKGLDRLRRSNWTGEHLYGDALDDVAQVIVAIENGAPFPKLERFRCPSLYAGSPPGTELRCQLQLPHECKHQAGGAAKSAGVEWTDEQSVNPPKPYDEPERSTCPSEYGPVGARVRCQLDPGHEGQHRHAMFQWGDDEAGDRTSLPKQCGAYWMDIRCELTRGHSEPHCGGKASWPHDYSTIVPVSDGGGA